MYNSTLSAVCTLTPADPEADGCTYVQMTPLDADSPTSAVECVLKSDWQTGSGRSGATPTSEKPGSEVFVRVSSASVDAVNTNVLGRRSSAGGWRGQWGDAWELLA